MVIGEYCSGGFWHDCFEGCGLGGNQWADKTIVGLLRSHHSHRLIRLA